MEYGEVAVLRFPETLDGLDRSGDCAFEELFVEHYPRLVNSLVRIIGNRSQAEELAAEAFFKLHKKNPRCETEQNLIGWLYRTAINLALDALRANMRRQRREVEAEKEAVLKEPRPDPLHELLAEEQRLRVRCVLSRLKTIHAEVLLICSNGFSCTEAAALLGLKSDSVYTLVGRAKKQFEQEYVKLYGRGTR
jgi:RNA polymerase sigma factor (sigma-70 family)